MSEITCQFVRPDRLLYEGRVSHVTLVTISGELGVWPGHASEICALGDGVVKLYVKAGKETERYDVVVSGGYAEIDNNMVIVLADHARRGDDIDPEVVRQTRQNAIDERDLHPEDDHRQRYFDEKIKWCNLLLKYVRDKMDEATTNDA